MDQTLQLKSAIDATWKRILAYPFGQVCKHLTVIILMDELGRHGFECPEALIKAVVNSDDETALTFGSIFVE